MPIVLSDAPVKRLETLQDAARLVSEHFQAKSGGVEHAADLLIKASETGAPQDVDVASLQVHRLLRFRQWV